MAAAYVSIGNSDDKLTQLEWFRFCSELEGSVHLEASRVYGVWYSQSYSQYQNMCVAAELDKKQMAKLRARLRKLAAEYRQDSIAVAIAPTTEFVAAAAPGEGGA